MTTRSIITLPDEKILRQVSKPLKQVDAAARTLFDDMLETMYDAPGIGLAAIQIGVPLRALVVDLAKEPAAAVGLSPVFVAAQAALESGWGKFEIRNKDGSSAHNLFSIKAGSSWTGKTVDVTTTEYVNGQPVKRVEKFRAYESYAEGLADYVKLLATNSRYKEAVAKGQDAQGFSKALAKAGYATDPAYSQKLASVIAKARAATGEA